MIHGVATALPGVHAAGASAGACATPMSAAVATSGSAAAATASPGPAPVDFTAFRGVLFDVDGTLVESDPLHFKAFQEILSELGYNGGEPITEDFFRHHISGRHNPEIAADLFPDWPEERRTQFYMDKEARYRRLAAQGLEALPGLREFLDWIAARGLRRAAVTNAPRANAEMMLAALGLDSYFEHLVLGEECARAKPHPDPYLTAMELLGLTPEESLVFEDSPSGVRAGVAAGSPVIALTTGQHPEVLAAAGAVWIIRDFRCVMDAIREAEARQ
ncbi:hypothetical protein HXX76_005655 [Chlamydomonas incerta]|uniref:Uncharacterized protein n=2 Tax=Chlamydomonas incerta TaxID=51695 RepID=A0A835W754_CHLIN|nr:hypothetical protein HXX76_005655 [Chlamydomonas incerta]|eukprot:KAG2438041.1 hypothetical protein HXX76_005655 [Chlamydomonas incerta]